MPCLTDQTIPSGPALASRAEILAEIGRLETRIAELRESLPTPVKSFYRFRCKPERQVFIYADSREQAVERLHERMNRDYPSGAWQVTSTHVDTFDDPQEAAVNAPGNLLRSIPPDQAREFVRDWREQQRGRAAKPNEFGTLPQIEKDVQDWERVELQRKG